MNRWSARLQNKKVSLPPVELEPPRPKEEVSIDSLESQLRELDSQKAMTAGALYDLYSKHLWGPRLKGQRPDPEMVVTVGNRMNELAQLLPVHDRRRSYSPPLRQTIDEQQIETKEEIGNIIPPAAEDVGHIALSTNTQVEDLGSSYAGQQG